MIPYIFCGAHDWNGSCTSPIWNWQGQFLYNRLKLINPSMFRFILFFCLEFGVSLFAVSPYVSPYTYKSIKHTWQHTLPFSFTSASSSCWRIFLMTCWDACPPISRSSSRALNCPALRNSRLVPKVHWLSSISQANITWVAGGLVAAWVGLYQPLNIIYVYISWYIYIIHIWVRICWYISRVLSEGHPTFSLWYSS